MCVEVGPVSLRFEVDAEKAVLQEERHECLNPDGPQEPEYRHVPAVDLPDGAVVMWDLPLLPWQLECMPAPLDVEVRYHFHIVIVSVAPHPKSLPVLCLSASNLGYLFSRPEYRAGSASDTLAEMQAAVQLPSFDSLDPQERLLHKLGSALSLERRLDMVTSGQPSLCQPIQAAIPHILSKGVGFIVSPPNASNAQKNAYNTGRRAVVLALLFNNQPVHVHRDGTVSLAREEGALDVVEMLQCLYCNPNEREKVAELASHFLAAAQAVHACNIQFASCQVQAKAQMASEDGWGGGGAFSPAAYEAHLCDIRSRLASAMAMIPSLQSEHEQESERESEHKQESEREQGSEQDESTQRMFWKGLHTAACAQMVRSDPRDKLISALHSLDSLPCSDVMTQDHALRDCLRQTLQLPEYSGIRPTSETPTVASFIRKWCDEHTLSAQRARRRSGYSRM